MKIFIENKSACRLSPTDEGGILTPIFSNVDL